MRVRAGKRSGRRSPIEPRIGSPSSLSPCLLEPHLAQRLVADSWGVKRSRVQLPAARPTRDRRAHPRARRRARLPHAGRPMNGSSNADLAGDGHRAGSDRGRRFRRPQSTCPAPRGGRAQRPPSRDPPRQGGPTLERPRPRALTPGPGRAGGPGSVGRTVQVGLRVISSRTLSLRIRRWSAASKSFSSFT